MAKLNQRTLDNATAIATEIQVEQSHMTLKDGWYARQLPEKFEGETPSAIAEEVHQIDHTCAHGIPLAMGRHGLDILKNDSNLEFVTGEADVGISKIQVKVAREGTNTIPPKEKGGEVTQEKVYGKTTVAIHTKSTAEMKRVRTEISEMATGFWGGK